MKFISAATTLAVAAVVACHGASTSVAAISKNNVESSVAPSALEALEAVESLETPVGVTLSGSVESISAPAATEAALGTVVAEGDESRHEGFGGVGHWSGAGLWSGAGWGVWSGWGGFGPHRFGFKHGGIGGWAYPLGY